MPRSGVAFCPFDARGGGLTQYAGDPRREPGRTLFPAGGQVC